MGYSARYHAASLIAVFLALAAGILIGAEFGNQVITSTRESLEQSLSESLEESREEVEELAGELNRSEELAERVYPTLVADELAGSRVAILAIGELSEPAARSVEEALEPTGAELVAIGVVRQPPQVDALARALDGPRFGGPELTPEQVGELAVTIGSRLSSGGTVSERLRGEVFRRVSGSFEGLDEVVVMRAAPEGVDPGEEEPARRLEEGLLRGLADGEATVVGVELSSAETSSVAFFDSHSVASVDNIDHASGRLSLVLALLGAQGNFGVKSSADSLLPDLIEPAGAAGASRR